MTVPTGGPTPLTEELRNAALNAEVAGYVRRGYAVESVAGFQAVMSKTRRMGLVLNLVLVFLTLGLWLIWLIYRALNRKIDRIVLQVDAYGVVRKV